MSLSNADSRNSDERGSRSGLSDLPSREVIESLPADGGDRFNRLVFEQSPYLLQHAANPVDWYPWGPEAFERARELDRMVFLSIGYSTCHWCHVMEHESFEDPEVAALMNENFICIKVDREERPDIDSLYMTVTQAMTGSGGWPMTVVMTPDKKPFFAGTYFPKSSRSGRPGMMELIPQLSTIWKGKKDEVLSYANNLTAELQQISTNPPGQPLTAQVIDQAYSELSGAFDAERGGFRGQRKFPLPHNLLFLLRYWHRTGEDRALEIVEKTLKAMRMGGIWDHIGFGTHRYSTDPEWLLPHFEKMMYDQALLCLAHVETWQATGHEFYRNTAEEILSYVQRDMTSAEGGFYSAEDADSEGEEGLFYIWTTDEIDAILGNEDGALFRRIFQFQPDGNFRDEATREKTGRNIPHLTRPLSEWAGELQISADELETRWNQWRTRLFEARVQRVHPLKDDKILTDWNGLMIAAMARAGAAFQEETWTREATRAADFVLRNLRRPDGTLMKRYRNGQSGLDAHLDDYAFLCWGLIELHQATQEPGWLENALELADIMEQQFEDEVNGGFFMTADSSEKLIARPREIHDGAIPSGNSVAALALLKLSRLTGQPRFEETAMKVFRAFSPNVTRGPSSYCFLLCALDFATTPGMEVVIASPDGPSDSAREMLRYMQQTYLPGAVYLAVDEGNRKDIVKLAEYAASQRPLDNRLTIYICRNFTCKQPVHTFEDARRSIENLIQPETPENPDGLSP